jgi:hypothetical protein
MMKRQLPEQITRRLVVWMRASTWWQSLHYIFGVTGTISSLLVAAKPVFLSTLILDTSAIISSISVVLLAFLIPSRRANAMRNSWRVLSIASERYLLDKNFGINDLLKVAEECEERISATDPA